MAENPLSGDELLAAGKGLASSIRATVESGRAYYLGRASREPSTPLSEVFNPETGPIIPFFVQVIRAVKRPPPLLAPWQSAAFGEFERECTDALDSMRRLTFELSPLLDAGDGRTAVGRSLKLSLCFFRIASGRLFRLLTRRRTFLRLLLRNHYNEGFGIYVANRFLNDIAKAFEARERQLRGESAAPAHEFVASQLEEIDTKLDSILDRLEDQPDKNDLLRTKRQILKKLDGDVIQEEKRTGPLNDVRSDQVATVRRILEHAVQGHVRKTLNEACLEAWKPLTGGYPTPKALYVYCHANRILFPSAG